MQSECSGVALYVRRCGTHSRSSPRVAKRSWTWRISPPPPSSAAAKASEDLTASRKPRTSSRTTRGSTEPSTTEHSVFEYLQEVYCFEADTYVCAGFDDPSKAKKSRTPVIDKHGPSEPRVFPAVRCPK